MQATAERGRPWVMFRRVKCIELALRSWTVTCPEFFLSVGSALADKIARCLQPKHCSDSSRMGNFIPVNRLARCSASRGPRSGKPSRRSGLLAWLWTPYEVVDTGCESLWNCWSTSAFWLPSVLRRRRRLGVWNCFFPSTQPAAISLRIMISTSVQRVYALQKCRQPGVDVVGVSGARQWEQTFTYP